MTERMLIGICCNMLRFTDIFYDALNAGNSYNFLKF